MFSLISEVLFAPVFEGLLYVEDQSPQTDFRVHELTWILFPLLVVEEQEVVNRKLN